MDAMAEVPTAEAFLDMGFNFLVGAALQRRVWMGQDPYRLYPNTYVTLVGPPSCGKGLVIRPIFEILRHHKIEYKGPPPSELLEKVNGQITSMEQLEELAIAKAQQEGDPELQALLEEEVGKKRKKKEPLLVFPMGADATTFESLTQTMAKATRRLPYKRLNPKTGGMETGVYTHCSLCFCLGELSSLIKVRTENIVNFFTAIYDCVSPYSYKTKHQGEDTIYWPCMNMIAGTTMSYMQDIFNDRILNDGYASRSWFVWASKPRFMKWQFSINPDKMKVLIDRVGKLAKVYGEVKFTPEAEAYLKEFWEVKMMDGSGRRNKSPKLDYYYGRKNIHVKKLAMVKHFAEVEIDEDGQCPMEIGLDVAKDTLETLDRIEGHMHEALQFGSANPLHKPMKAIHRYVQQYPGGVHKRDLFVEFWQDLPAPQDDSLDRILEYMVADGIIVTEIPEASKAKRGMLIKPYDKLHETLEAKEITTIL